MGRNVSALTQPNMPQKCKDPGTFTVPCTIENFTFSNALLDLGASINVLPTSIYRSLSLSPLKQIDVVIQLANRSTAFPTGVVEDMIMKVDKLIFSADFYILNMAEKSSMPTLILGRPFLKTVRTKIDVYSRILSMEFGDDVMQFKIFEAMKHPLELHRDLCKVCTKIDAYLAADDVSCDAVAGLGRSSLITASTHTLEPVQIHAAELDFSIRTLLSIIQPPILELKPLPKNLKYAFLEIDNKLPVIISVDLDAAQE
ncbi:uncharacterized protein LOC113866097 [Abrus precatorius]|uniref:Uncharacterized protein LOC113866097 n=1 Tax=Abrus precatorius TaxID=3816 RepID=A0A8B8LN21_ABRPR|nr:uncharacterized protein LOC113866097 [Abrus precatorius]